MLPLERQRSLVEQYALIPDVHERLALVVDRARRRPPLAAELKTNAALVPGCTSRVWLVGTLKEGRCHFQLDADSSLVRGLAALVCEVYEGATPGEAATADADILEELGLAAHLTPTRRHGLEQVRHAVRLFARRAHAGDSA